MNITELYEVFLAHRAISTDSRKEVAGSLFFALRGENFNGNDFAEEAVRKGAAFAVVDEGDWLGNRSFIKVDDSLAALQQLARFHRQKTRSEIIAITGSNGKTTTKELVRDVLLKKYRVYSTEGNLNNHIGVPLSLLRISDDIQFGIIEMGANHEGEIGQLCTIACPDFGMITNIGKAHLEGFGSLEGVRKAKGELYKYLSEEGGKVFIHADNNTLMEMAAGLKSEMIMYGDTKGSVCSASVKGLYPTLSVGIRWHNDQVKEYTCSTKLVGSYNRENILAAACIGRYFGVEPGMIIDAVEEYDPGMMRSQLIERERNILVVDTYNANPSSMEAAIIDFDSDPYPGKILVLGEMKELGHTELEEHKRLIEYLQDKSFSKILLVGTVFSRINVPDSYLTFKSADECGKWLDKHPVENSKILLKGSRLIKLEGLIKYF